MLVKCIECQKEISDTVESCPHCGFKPKKKTSIIIKIGWTILISLVLIAIFAEDPAKKQQSTEPSAQQADQDLQLNPPIQPETPKTPPIEINAATLAHNYDVNEARADLAYKGKTLKVTGTVTSIDKNFTDDTIVRMKGLNQFSDVMAIMQPSQLEKAAALKKGQQITVICMGSGMIIKSPSLRECEFI